MEEYPQPIRKEAPDISSYRKFVIFLGGQLISLLGSSISQFAIIWWLTITTKSPFILGLAAVLGFGSTMLVIPFSGVLVDRWSRRKVIAFVDGMEAVATVVLIILFYSGVVETWHILLISVVRGIFQGFHDPAIQAIIPLLVPREKLNTINSFNYLGNGIINLIGPVVAAVLLAIVGTDRLADLLWIDVATFLVAVTPLIFTKIPSVRKEHQKLDFRKELSEGIGFIKETKGLLSLLSAFSFANFFGTPLFILLPLIVINPTLLSGDQTILAFAMSASSLGAILASFVMSRKILFRNNVTGVYLGLLFMYIAIFVAIAGAITHNIYLFYAGILVNGASVPIANISSQTIWQQAVPMQLQGRVYSVRRFIAQVSAPIAMFFSGYFADIFSISMVIIFATGTGMAIMLYLWFATALSHVEEIIPNINTEQSEVPALS